MNVSHKLIKLAARAMLMLGLTASAAAWALPCDVTVVSVSGSQALLKANCGTGATGVQWFRNSTTPLSTASWSTPSTTDINYTTTLISGTNQYSATATANIVTTQTGLVATIITEDPSLTVALGLAAGTAGTVTSSSPVFSCSSGFCTTNLPMGTAVSLVATPGTASFFGGWGGDCSGTGACVLAMTGPHTVTASFNSAPPPPAPSCSLSASQYSVTQGTLTNVTLTATCSNSPQTYAWSGTPTVLGSGSQVTASFPANQALGTYAYSVTATNLGGPGSASTSVTVSATPPPSPPSCTLSASPTAVISVTPTDVTLTATCTGSPTSWAWIPGTGAPAVNGIGGSVTATFPTNIAGTYTYSVTATNIGGTSLPASASVTAAVASPSSTPGLPANCVVKDITSGFGHPFGDSAAYAYQPAAETWAYRMTFNQLFSPTRQAAGPSALYSKVFTYDSYAATYSLSLTSNPCEFHNTAPAGFCQTKGYLGASYGEIDLRYRASTAAGTASYCVLPAPAGQISGVDFWYVNLRHAAGSTVEVPYPNSCTASQCGRYVLRDL